MLLEDTLLNPVSHVSTYMKLVMRCIYILITVISTRVPVGKAGRFLDVRPSRRIILSLEKIDPP